MTGTAPLIALDSVGKRFGSRWIFRGLNAQIPERGIFALTGPSGIGKTTLGRIALKLDVPSEGHVNHSRDLRVSAQFAEDRFVPNLTVNQNLEYVGLAPAKLHPLAGRLGMAEAMSAYPHELSSGMRRRAAFIRAVSSPGDILLLDEPFKGVDAALGIALAEEITRQGSTRAVLLIDHDQTLVSTIADHMYPLD